jgi:tRNA(Arg) A34 adenosine deaminase TadA
MKLADFIGVRLPGRGDAYRAFSLARKMAATSDHKVPMGAVVTRRGQVLTCGRNHAIRTHPMASPRNGVGGIHAEVDAIIGTDRDTFYGATMWIYRERKDRTIGLARPCQACYTVLSGVGIRNAIFTDPASKHGYGEIRIR